MRHGFVLLFAVFQVGCACRWVDMQPDEADNQSTWYSGQLHTHSYCSDGRGFPEQVIDVYKQRGYQFLSITDHNRFADDDRKWRKVENEEGRWPWNVTQAMFAEYAATYGNDWVETKTNEGVVSVRLKTYRELKARFEEPGEFVLLPGVEITQKFKNLAVHLNYINLPTTLPCIENARAVKKINGNKTMSDLLALNVSEAERAAIEAQEPYILMLNHPFWSYYDIEPQSLIDCPEMRFFEVCNGGSSFAPHPQAQDYTPEKFWDIVNAFRLIQGHKLLYGIGTDDAHSYEETRIDGKAGVGDAWVMVRAAALTPKHLIEAMHQGDFYATSGVLLEDVTFTPADRTLHVRVKADPGVSYRIHFITTKNDFDQNVTRLTSPAAARRPARTVPVYSEDIGRTVKSVQGVEASYQMRADDLYVRARVESDTPSKLIVHFHPKVETAWTQPYAHH